MKQAKNAVERHVIWSDIHLDLDDWRDFLMENYPELPEDKLYEKMHELNAEYLDDERRNLDIQFSQPILVIGDLPSDGDGNCGSSPTKRIILKSTLKRFNNNAI